MIHHHHDHAKPKAQSRVQIRYEVETENGTQERELPFVIGVIGDFSASNTDIPSLKEREFINIDNSNFDEVMAQINPKLHLVVDNVMNDAGSLLPLNLNFKSIHDFEPERLINQIEPLAKLKLARDRLRSLLNRTECSEELENNLKTILSNEKFLLQLAAQIPELAHE